LNGWGLVGLRGRGRTEAHLPIIAGHLPNFFQVLRVNLRNRLAGLAPELWWFGICCHACSSEQVKAEAFGIWDHD
jgi:hypothetical protein